MLPGYPDNSGGFAAYSSERASYSASVNLFSIMDIVHKWGEKDHMGDGSGGASVPAEPSPWPSMPDHTSGIFAPTLEYGLLAISLRLV